VRKPLALIASLALLCAGWVVTDALVGEAKRVAVVEPVAGVAPVEPPTIAVNAAMEHVPDTRVAATTEAAAENVPPRTGPCLRVVDSEGQPALGARAAWVDHAGEVHQLALGQDATALLPADSAGGHVFATAPGLALASAKLEETPVELVLTLPSRVSLRGRVTVNGAVPSTPILLVLEPGIEMLRTDGPWRERAQAELAALGFRDPKIEARTDTGGQFEFRGVHPRGQGGVLVPGSYHVVGKDWTGIGYSLPKDEELILDLEREPYLAGRVFWADSREPVKGTLTAMRVARGIGTSDGWGGRLTADGHFEVQLPDAEDGNGRRHSRVTLEFHPEAAQAVEHSFEYDLEGVKLSLDVGTLQIERTQPLALRVLSASGAPIFRAHVLVPGETRATDTEGRVSLSAPADGWLHVIAAEHALESVRVAELERDREGTAVVRLTAGRTLRVSLGACSVPPGHGVPNLILAWEVDPFEPFHAAGDPARADRTRTNALFAFHGESVEAMRHRTNSTSGDIELEWQGDAPLVIPGLRPGARIVLGLRSAIEEAVLLEQEVTIPTTPGTLDISLASGAYALRGIELVTLDAEGEPLVSAAYAAKRPDDRYWSSVRASAWPLPEGPLQFQAGAPGYAAQTVDLAAGSTSSKLSIQLQPARELVVRVQEEGGTSLRPERVTAVIGSRRFGRFGDGESTTLTAVPCAPGEVEIALGGRLWRAPFDAAASEVTVRVPRHGTVRVTLAKPPAISEEWGEWGLFVSVAGTEEPQTSHKYTAEAVGASTLELPLLPGAHVLEVRGRELRGTDRAWRVLRSLEVNVVAGEVSKLEL
jgi:hypothetical protein